MAREYRTKQGKHGTLYYWQIECLEGPWQNAIPVGPWRVWAYTKEQAWEIFHDGNDDVGFGTEGDFVRVTA